MSAELRRRALHMDALARLAALGAASPDSHGGESAASAARPGADARPIDMVVLLSDDEPEEADAAPARPLEAAPAQRGDQLARLQALAAHRQPAEVVRYKKGSPELMQHIRNCKAMKN